MIADPQVAKDCKWAGIDALSLAMNHSFDWGPEGIRSTIKYCRENGIAHAGTGENLEEARRPGFFDVDKYRCAIVSLASGNNVYEWAGLPKGSVPGRPGMNPLRVSTRYEVPHAAAARPKAIGKCPAVMSNAAAAGKEVSISPA